MSEDTSTGTDQGSTSEDVVPKKEYLRLVDQQKAQAGQIAQLTSQLEKYSGIDLDKIAADSARLDELLRNQGAEGEQELEARIQSRYQSTLDEQKELIERQSSTIKNLRVVDSCMKHHGSFFVDRSQDEIRSIVSRHGDYDEKLNTVVFKNDQGEVRYSSKEPSRPMSVEEFFGEISASRPYLAKSDAASGSMDGTSKSHTSPAKPNYAVGGSVSEQIARRQVELEQGNGQDSSANPSFASGLNYT